MVDFGDGQFGCLWAPDVTYDSERDDYVVHWSSAHRSNDFGDMAIYYARTDSFETFSEPELLYRKPDSGVIDSAMYEEDGTYYCFLKSDANPGGGGIVSSSASDPPVRSHACRRSTERWRD